MSKINLYLQGKLKFVDSLLPVQIYTNLYNLVKSERPENIIEIGTAHGAGTIAMGLSCIDNEIDCQIQTIDVFEETKQIPSSRSKFGDKNKNVEIVREHFQQLGVAKIIDIFAGDSDLFFSSDAVRKKYDFVVIDADGRIDRDLIHLKPFLKKNAILIIDDIDGHPQMQNPLGRMKVDLKHVITKKLVEGMKADKYITEIDVWGNTGVYRANNPANWQLDKIQNMAIKCYRELVFVKYDNPTFIKALCLQLLQKNKFLFGAAMHFKTFLKSK